ncbi:MAG: alpha/beta hydrolase [Actinomycetota bacterium]|nr:alpha/beta hydrolase [Actinomycetota bacterium]
MAEVVANGVRFHVQQLTPPQGSAAGQPTVVFIHGLVMDNLSSFYYTLANPCAVGGADVVLYDLRGHGRSERPPMGYALDDSVDDLAGLLAALGIDGPVHIVGNSYGGTVGLAFALAYPEQVASLVLIEGHFAVQGWGEEMARTLWGIAFGMELDEARAWVAAAGRKMTRMAGKADALINHTTLVEDLLTAIPLPRAPLASLSCPVLAIYGDESDVIDRARDLATLVPDFTLNILAGCGHSILMEVPSHLRAVLAWWLGGRHGPAPLYQPPSPSAPALAGLVT